MKVTQETRGAATLFIVAGQLEMHTSPELRGPLRTALGKSLHVRRVPELRFQEDRSHAGAQRIEEVLAENLEFFLRGAAATQG